MVGSYFYHQKGVSLPEVFRTILNIISKPQVVLGCLNMA